MRATLLLCLSLTLVTFFLPQQITSERTVTLVFQDRIEIVKESDARAEYDQLVKAGSVNTPRFVALTLALGTIPSQCSAGQVYAGLCLPEQLDTKEKP